MAALLIMHDDMLIIAMKRLLIIHDALHNYVIMKVIVTTTNPHKTKTPREPPTKPFSDPPYHLYNHSSFLITHTHTIVYLVE